MKKYVDLPAAAFKWLTEERLLRPDMIKRAGIRYATDKKDFDRIAFPNNWEKERVISWKCRIAPHIKLAEEDRKKKWKFDPPGKKAAVYGCRFWPEHVTDVFQCEGELDCLLLNQEGFPSITSTTGVKTNHEECLKQLPQGVRYVIAHDNDETGQKAVDALASLVCKNRPDITLCRIEWPEGFGKDVTDFFRHCRDRNANPVEEFKALIKPYPTAPESEEKASLKSGKRESQVDILLRLVTDQNCILFHDQFKEPHARFHVGDHWEVWKARSKQFKRWLGYLLWEAEGDAPTSETISTVLNVLEAKALFKGEMITLENRIAWHEDAVWYDLGDRQCRAVRIASDGWRIIDHPPVLFRRFAHQEAQLVPARGGTMEAFLPFVNLADKEKQGPLLLTYLVSCFVPGIPHPIPNLHGSQGSAKTTLARMLRRIVDPSKMEVLSFPSNGKEFVQQLAHNYFAFFDNISEVTESVSDLLCRAVTGEGVSKRELYTDDEDVIYTFRRCIGLNGINPAAKKPDLLDRSILMKLERIPEEKRREERIVLSEFDAVRPELLGAVFDALSLAMSLRESVRLERLPRMADFTRWGCAIAQALGYSQDDFLNAYYANITEQNLEAIQENPVAAAMKAFMHGRTEWEGIMSELYEHLVGVADTEKIDVRAKEWPKAANALSRRLNEAETNLKAIGIVFRSDKGTHGKRVVLIERVEGNTADTATSPPVATDSDPFGGDSSDDSPKESPQTSLPISPPQKPQQEATERIGGGGGDVPSAPKTPKQTGLFHS